MFGHEDDQSGQQDSNQIPDQSIDGALGDETTTTQAAPSAPVTQTVQPSAPAQTPISAPPADTTAQPLSSNDAPAAAADQPNDDQADDQAAEPVDQNTLIDIKQQALTQLSPLLGHLDQSPEEKFRTTMMMIQASDDQNMIKTAFAAAQNISDEKTRAQALLDVVNEINYFTQHDDSQQQE